MSVVAAIRAMLAQGLTVEQALAAAEAIEQSVAPQLTARQERNRRYYEAHRASEKRLNPSESVLEASETSELRRTPSPPPSPSPDKETSPRPPKENNPTPLPPPQPKTSKRTRLNADWVLPKAMGDWALAQGLPRERILLEAEKMRDWAVNAGSKGLKADWFAAWRNWVKGAIDDLPKARGSPGVRPKSGLAAVMEEFKQELAEDGYGDQGQEGRNSQNDERFPLLAGPRDK